MAEGGAVRQTPLPQTPPGRGYRAIPAMQRLEKAGEIFAFVRRMPFFILSRFPFQLLQAFYKGQGILPHRIRRLREPGVKGRMFFGAYTSGKGLLKESLPAALAPEELFCLLPEQGSFFHREHPCLGSFFQNIPHDYQRKRNLPEAFRGLFPLSQHLVIPFQLPRGYPAVDTSYSLHAVRLQFHRSLGSHRSGSHHGDSQVKRMDNLLMPGGKIPVGEFAVQQSHSPGL